MVEGKAPRRVPAAATATFFPGIELVEAEESNRPLIVGERTNVIGSRLFKQMIAAEKWEEASEIARRQVRNGAHIVDVCLQSSEREEIKDIPPFYDRLIRKIKAPVMIDTTDPAAVELALTYCQGKSIINSVNLEDGEEKFERVCPLARAYGAALVVGTIDEDPVQAQAFTRERKLAVAERSVTLLTEKYGIPPEDIIIDALVFPCATGDENYIGGAVETIEAVRLIKRALPYVKTVLGISNVSFGLPAAAREVVNSVFLYHATKAGLDLAIVNAEKLERFASIPEEERRLAENLLFNTPAVEDAPAPDWREQTREQKIAINQYHIAAITEHFRQARRAKQTRAGEPAARPAPGQLHRRGHPGRADRGPRPEAEEGAAPLDIINGPLMAGMTEVGRLFNNNELIVAEVLQSAEAMKAAVTHLEQFMEKADTAARGKMILATVKGDVHDIGKNLVEIILSNNGYQVINLGIKVPPEEMIRAFHEHAPDAIGLSGLLVKSAQQMVVTAGDLKEAGIRVPLLVGGAALSEKFTRLKIAPAYGEAVCYAKDAMTGLRLMNQLMDPASREAVLRAHTHRDAPAEEPVAAAPAQRHRAAQFPKFAPTFPIPRRRTWTARCATCRSWPRCGATSTRTCSTASTWATRATSRSGWPSATRRRWSCSTRWRRSSSWAAGFMKVRAVWQFFEAEREGNSIHLFGPGAASPVHTFHFGRQAREDGLCLSDYVLDPDDGRRDHIALFVVTAGEGIRERAEAAKAAGEFFNAPRPPGAGARDGRRRRRVAAPPHPRGLGLPRPALDDHARPLHVPLPRQALQLRLRRLS